MDSPEDIRYVSSVSRGVGVVVVISGGGMVANGYGAYEVIHLEVSGYPCEVYRKPPYL